MTLHRLGWLVAVAWTALLPICAVAHPYHASLAEVDYNPERQNLEVALRVLPEELEAVLSERAGKAVNLDATEDVDALIVAYLNETFRLLTDQAPSPPLQWLGKEVSHRAAWLYFEIAIDPQLRWSLENRVLFDYEPQQVNTVLLRLGETQASLTFDARNPISTLPMLQADPGSSGRMSEW